MTTDSGELPAFDDLWDYDHPAETEGRFREVLALSAASASHAYIAELLTQIARTQGLQRRFKEAHDTLDEVQTLLEESTESAAHDGDFARAHIRYSLERGRVFNSSKHPEEAKPFFLEALSLASQHREDGYAVDAAHMMAIIEDPAKQLPWNLKALDLAQKSQQARAKRWLGSLYNNIGWTYHDAGHYDEALEMFQKTLKHREKQAQDSGRQQDHNGVRVARWCVARALRSLGHVDEALSMQMKLEEEYRGIGEPGGDVYEEIAECLLVMGRHDEAHPYFALAYQELAKDPALVEDEAPRLQRLRELGGD